MLHYNSTFFQLIPAQAFKDTGESLERVSSEPPLALIHLQQPLSSSRPAMTSHLTMLVGLAQRMPCGCCAGQHAHPYAQRPAFHRLRHKLREQFTPHIML